MFPDDFFTVIANGFIIMSIGATIPLFAFILTILTYQRPFMSLKSALWICFSMIILLGLAYQFASNPNGIYSSISFSLWVVILILISFIKAMIETIDRDKQDYK
ncbi:hypothetical protein MKY91_20510 [Alkalicoccobacillus gibsonii]|uniref:Uncharacterized protein n=1 Tax=Alkalicoccobacillus gibsonii TaxID=79881 RepID=A0ABU9VRP9_9BACI